MVPNIELPLYHAILSEKCAIDCLLIFYLRLLHQY